MKLSYEIIRKIHRLEKGSVKLVKLEDNFFEGLKSFLEDEKEKIKQNEDVFDDSKTQRLFNIKNMIEDILYLRQKKIINKAIIKVKTGNEDVSDLLLPEQKMYKQISEIFEDYQGYLKTVFDNNHKPKVKYNLMKMKIIQSVPKFIGTDMQEYGPYDENEVIEIPESIAKLFINKGIAEQM